MSILSRRKAKKATKEQKKPKSVAIVLNPQAEEISTYTAPRTAQDARVHSSHSMQDVLSRQTQQQQGGIGETTPRWTGSHLSLQGSQMSPGSLRHRSAGDLSITSVMERNQHEQSFFVPDPNLDPALLKPRNFRRSAGSSSPSRVRRRSPLSVAILEEDWTEVQSDPLHKPAHQAHSTTSSSSTANEFKQSTKAAVLQQVLEASHRRPSDLNLYPVPASPTTADKYIDQPACLSHSNENVKANDLSNPPLLEAVKSEPQPERRGEGEEEEEEEEEEDYWPSAFREPPRSNKEKRRSIQLHRLTLNIKPEDDEWFRSFSNLNGLKRVSAAESDLAPMSTSPAATSPTESNSASHSTAPTSASGADELFHQALVSQQYLAHSRTRDHSPKTPKSSDQWDDTEEERWKFFHDRNNDREWRVPFQQPMEGDVVSPPGGSIRQPLAPKLATEASDPEKAPNSKSEYSDVMTFAQELRKQSMHLNLVDDAGFPPTEVPVRSYTSPSVKEVPFREESIDHNQSIPISRFEFPDHKSRPIHGQYPISSGVMHQTPQFGNAQLSATGLAAQFEEHEYDDKSVFKTIPEEDEEILYFEREGHGSGFNNYQEYHRSQQRPKITHEFINQEYRSTTSSDARPTRTVPAIVKSKPASVHTKPYQTPSDPTAAVGSTMTLFPHHDVQPDKNIETKNCVHSKPDVPLKAKLPNRTQFPPQLTITPPLTTTTRPHSYSRTPTDLSHNRTNARPQSATPSTHHPAQRNPSPMRIIQRPKTPLVTFLDHPEETPITPKDAKEAASGEHQGVIVAQRAKLTKAKPVKMTEKKKKGKKNSKFFC